MKYCDKEYLKLFFDHYEDGLLLHSHHTSFVHVQLIIFKWKVGG